MAVVETFANLGLYSESDVEQKLIYPLLNRPEWCNIPADAIKTKKFIPSFDIGKGRGEKKNYSPDYAVYASGFPVLVVEAKSKGESLLGALQEARLYALALNAKYPSDLNPVEIIAACNGDQIAVARWDSDERFVFDLNVLAIGSNEHRAVMASMGWSRLAQQGQAFQRRHAPDTKRYPFSLAGGADILKKRVGSNSFSEPLASLIEYYFQALTPEAEREILDKAYISSDNITKYERLFEDYLRQRVVPASDKSGIAIAPQGASEPKLTGKIWEYAGRDDGGIQLLIGHVGSGKSSFIARFMNFLQPQAMKNSASWVYIDCNAAPVAPAELEAFILEQFISQLTAENANNEDFYRQVFGPQIIEFRKLHQNLYNRKRDTYEEYLSDEKRKWFSDKRLLASAIARRVRKELRRLLIVVLDNTDRRSQEIQVRLFEVAQWFKGLTGAFCLLSLRDSTWERHKDEPPLDTLQNATHFYITPPRFYDVVERRLGLARENIARFVPEEIQYDVRGVGRISYPRAKVADFLACLYSDIFRERKLIGVILESLADRNVRRSLDMFARMIQSGHLSEANITRVVVGPAPYTIQEHVLIRALMRQDYKYFTDTNGFVTNIFDCIGENVRAGVFLRSEILSYLIDKRKSTGDNGIEGFKQVSGMISELELIGYSREYLKQELDYLFKRGLVVSDNDDKDKVEFDDFVRVHASGWAHFTFLIRRVEYLHSAALITPIGGVERAKRIGEMWMTADDLGMLPIGRQKDIVRLFLEQLRFDYKNCCAMMPLFEERAIGAQRLISRVEESLDFDAAKRGDVSADRLWEAFKDKTDR